MKDLLLQLRYFCQSKLFDAEISMEEAERDIKRLRAIIDRIDDQIYDGGHSNERII
jgi:hypothetical protein